MADFLRRFQNQPAALTAAAVVDGRPQRRALTSAALSRRAGRDVILPRYEHWQDEAWAYWQELGEVYYGVRWISEMLSRIRLIPATVPESGGDEPALYEGGGTPADLLERFGGGLGGQAEILRRLGVQLNVPGEGWLVGEPDTDSDQGGDRWTVRSADEIRRSSRKPDRGSPNGNVLALPRTRGSSALGRLGGNGRGYNVEVVDEQAPPGSQKRWRVLPMDALVVRIWNPHDRYYTQADSPVRHALSVARRLQLANRYIQAQFLSRLASAGLVILPDNVDFPVRPEFEGEPDALMREFIAVAETAIQTPGSALAIVPLLMQLPPDVIDKIAHIDFTTAFDQKILEKRESAVRELATVIDLPAEILLGLGDSNHWTSWQIEETALKVHISPRIEAICHAFTDGWYRPMLKAASDDPSKYLVWYDPSEIVVRPDKSEKVVVAYDRGEASGDALRRESGLDEADKPEDEDLREWALKQGVLGKWGEALVPVAYKELTGEELEVPAPAAPPVPGRTPGEDTEGEEEAGDANERRQPPGTQSEPPPPPDESVPREAATMTAPGTGWPMRRFGDGDWRVWNVNYWLGLGPERSAIIDRHHEAIAVTMNGKAADAPVGS
jgi:hypothetical protein